MTATYRIFPEHRLVVITLKDRITRQEIAADRERLKNDPRFDAEFDQILDLRDADNRRIKYGDVEEIASTSLFQTNIRKVLVAPTDLSFGTSRMYEALSDALGQQVKVVRSMPEALAWLGFPGVFIDIIENKDGDCPGGE